jgi:GDPmannose 4,6-dehydratase
MNQVALITGITGQDGIILSNALVKNGIKVHGTTRSLDNFTKVRLRYFENSSKLDLHEVNLTDKNSLQNLLNSVNPTLIFNFGSMSSVRDSFQNPFQAKESIEKPTEYILEWIKNKSPETVFFNPGSSEIFGDTNGKADENHVFLPKSPYAKAKANAYNLSKVYREEFGLNVINGILFNHESHYRYSKFFSKKVITTACAIYNGQMKKLSIGNLHGIRDWGWANDYVSAMLALVEHKKFEDYVIATGEGNSLENFIKTVFAKLDLEWLEHTEVSSNEYRTNDITTSIGNSTKILREVGWMPSKTFDQLIDNLIEQQLKNPYE